jgi:hypothetical protein
LGSGRKAEQKEEFALDEQSKWCVEFLGGRFIVPIGVAFGRGLREWLKPHSDQARSSNQCVFSRLIASFYLLFGIS